MERYLRQRGTVWRVRMSRLEERDWHARETAMWFGWYDIPYESNVIIYVLGDGEGAVGVRGLCRVVRYDPGGGIGLLIMTISRPCYLVVP